MNRKEEKSFCFFLRGKMLFFLAASRLGFVPAYTANVFSCVGGRGAVRLKSLWDFFSATLVNFAFLKKILNADVYIYIYIFFFKRQSLLGVHLHPRCC